MTALPESKKERDELRARTLTAINTSRVTELDRLEREAVAVRERGRADEQATHAVHDAADREHADALARDVFAKPLLTLSRWRKTQSREDVRTLVGELRDLNARAVYKLGEGLRPITAALLMAQLFAEEAPALIAQISAPPFFEGAFGFGGQLLDLSSGALTNALTGNVLATEDALRRLELQINNAALAANDVPTERQKAKWLAQLESGRDRDFSERLRALGEQHKAEDFAALEAAPQDEPASKPEAGDDAESDADFDAETEALARLAQSKKVDDLPAHDTEHFDRLAAEQRAPRAVPQRG